MILRRLGNKAKIAGEIYKLTPQHNILIELFMGAGGYFFNTPRKRVNILNDIDSNVINCFDVLMNQKDELKHYLEMLPIHADMWERAKKEVPKNDIEKAVYFLLLSNFGYMGKPDTLHIDTRNSKAVLLKNMELAYKELTNSRTTFLNTDFADVLSKISLEETSKPNSFIYSDPPYFQTGNNYDCPEWTEEDVKRCMDATFNNGINAAMSEFDHPFVIEQAKLNKLHVIELGERKNMKNRRTEILVTNYEQRLLLF